jgi:ketosteroid isomerase-like protein
MRNELILNRCLALALSACLAALACSNCAPAPPARPLLSAAMLESALARYQDIVRRMDNRALVAMLTPDAVVSHGAGAPLRGHDTILAFLDSLAAYKVRSFDIAGQRVSVRGEEALQEGEYEQAVQVPDGALLTVRGRFTATWKRQPDGTLKLARMHTESRQ